MVAGCYQVFVVLFRPEPPWFNYQGTPSWGEGAVIAATVLLAVAAGLCLFDHLLAWPSDGARRPPLPLLVSATAAVAYIVLAVTAHWFTSCTAVSTSSPQLPSPANLFRQACVPVSYRGTAAAELTVFLSILMLLAIALLVWGPPPVERLAGTVTGAVSLAIGMLAILVVAEILRTRSSAVDHLQIGGWLTLVPAVAFIAAGIATLRDA